MKKDDISKLISDAAATLHSKGNDGMKKYVGVEYPACVLYYGESTSSFHNGILEALQSEWGIVASIIPFYTILNPDLSGRHALKDMQTSSDADVKAFQRTIMNVQGAKNSNFFNDSTVLYTFCVVDTRGMGPGDFHDWYAVADRKSVV